MTYWHAIDKTISLPFNSATHHSETEFLYLPQMLQARVIRANCPEKLSSFSCPFPVSEEACF